MKRWTGRLDALLAGALALLGLVTAAGASGSLTGGTGWRAPGAVIATLALTVPLAWRRVVPRAVLLVVAAATAAIWALQVPDGTTAIAGSIALYSVGRHVARRDALRLFAAVAVGLGLVAGSLAATASGADGWARFFARVGVVVAAYWYGDSQRSRAILLDALQDRARRTEAERAESERRAVLEERERIARELHDVVAHSLSVMVVQATAASRFVERDPPRASAAIAHVVDVGRSALQEMRQVLGRLDEPAAGTALSPVAGPVDSAADGLARPVLAPPPSLADLDPLVDRCRAAGLAVVLERGDLPGGLPAGVELAVVRVAQEGLTNVLKHAPRSEAVVRLGGAAPDVPAGGAVVVEVINGAGPAGGAEPRLGAGDGRGRGLIGLRERVESLGGTFRAGPRPDGGFAVHAVMPVGGRS